MFEDIICLICYGYISLGDTCRLGRVSNRVRILLDTDNIIWSNFFPSCHREITLSGVHYRIRKYFWMYCIECGKDEKQMYRLPPKCVRRVCATCVYNKQGYFHMLTKRAIDKILIERRKPYTTQQVLRNIPFAMMQKRKLYLWKHVEQEVYKCDQIHALFR